MKTLLIYIHLNGNLMFIDWNINDYNINDIVKIIEFLCSFLRLHEYGRHFCPGFCHETKKNCA